MAKKQFIRHLEFYGFPDQNGYSSEINGVDLSDIREKNKEQDEEIQDLEGEKADKKDLIVLSGTVENFITRQSEINQEFADAISGMSGDIEELKAIDTEFAEQLSAITSGVDEMMDAIDILDDRVGDIEDSISGLSDAIESITEDYAKKEDVYSKEEIDEMISSGFSGYATQEWVEEQGYITEEEADAIYAKIEDMKELSGAVESAATDIDGRLEEINDSIDDVNDKVDGLAEDISGFSKEVESAISEVNEAVEEVNNKVDDITSNIADIVEVVSGNTSAIDELNQAVSASTEAIENLDEKVDEAVSELREDIQEVNEELDNKANISELETLHDEMTQGFENIETKKADKEDLEAVSGAVDSVDAKVNAEIARSTSVDTAMQGKINQLDADVQEAVEKVDSYEGRIEDLETELAQEIIDRQNGDIALIGTSGDSENEDTIWAAKNLAGLYKEQTITSAKTYTNDKVAELNGELQNLENRIDQKFTHYATEDFVISACNDTETEVRNEFTTSINNETQRAEQVETNLEVQIQSLAAQIISDSERISTNSSRINAITAWEGTDPEQYDDSGNGILDVLHREFHEYEKTHGSIKSIEYVDGNLIITYITPEGEKQEIIPISELIVLDDYYKKEEVDILLDEKVDKTEYEDVTAQVRANTENIGILSGDVEDIKEELSGKTDLALFNALVEKLGYTDNETLERNNEHEVAFGSYNISNTDSETSGQTIFSVGIGTSDADRKNALEVRKDGGIYAWIEGEFMNINQLLGQISHEVYDTDSNP